MSGEFDLIARYFTVPAPVGMLGVGDDCALVPVAPGYQLATSTDLLIQGRHFLPDVSPVALGHKALAVNLSDLAAMGARPLACLLSLGLPRVDEAWLAGFSQGFLQLAERAGCALVGGDTTRSDIIVINVTVLGQVAPAQALRRSAALPGDTIWVTGSLGAPDVALELLQQSPCSNPGMLARVRPLLETPEPPVAMAPGLAGLAHAAIDISDGLLQDLGHVLKASRCGAQLDFDALPMHPALAALPEPRATQAVLCGGDVYQLCFTARADATAAIHELAARHGVDATLVGRVVETPGLQVLRRGQPIELPERGGFDHFA